MKKSPTLGVLIFAAIFLTTTDAFAVSTTVNKTVSATVDSVLSLSVTLFKDSNLSTPIPTMDFGTLIRPTNPDGSPGALMSISSVRAFMGVLSSGQRYTITQNMAALSNGTQTLPDAIICVPASASVTGGALGSIESARKTNKLIYTSNTAGDAATVEVVYGVSGGPAAFAGWQPIPPNQASGTYTSTLIYTLTTL